MLITYSGGVIEVENYFTALNVVADNHVNTFTLASENGQATYTLEWLHSNTAAMFGKESDVMYNVARHPDGTIVAGIRNWADGRLADAATVTGADQYDMLAGTVNDDVITAGNNGAELYGDDGNDQLVGGAGVDYIRGGAGNDTLTGNGGADVFMIDDGNDVITDATSADTIKMVVADHTTFDGITFAQGTGDKLTSLLITYSGGVIEVENYFTALNVVADNHVNTFTLASENGQAAYTLEWDTSMYRVVTGTNGADNVEAVAGIPNRIGAGAGNDTYHAALANDVKFEDDSQFGENNTLTLTGASENAYVIMTSGSTPEIYLVSQQDYQYWLSHNGSLSGDHGVVSLSSVTAMKTITDSAGRVMNNVTSTYGEDDYSCKLDAMRADITGWLTSEGRNYGSVAEALASSDANALITKFNAYNTTFDPNTNPEGLWTVV